MGSHSKSIVHGFFAFFLLLSSGCSLVSIRETSLGTTIDEISNDVVMTGRLSLDTVQFFHINGVPFAPEDNPGKAFKVLDETKLPMDEALKSLSLAEVALYQAIKIRNKTPEEKTAWFLAAADESLHSIRLMSREQNFFPGLNEDRARRYYNRAVAGFIKETLRLKKHSFHHRAYSFLNTQYMLEIEKGPESIDPDRFEKILLSAELKVKGLDHHFRVYGLGVALTAYSPNTLQSKEDKYFPRAGICRPLSAVILFDETHENIRKCRLAFYDSWFKETLHLNDREFPLTSDFSTPLGYLAAKTKKTSSAVIETIFPEKQIEDAGFCMVEPYDPNRIPLITVHGLLANPLTWANLHNDLLGDPVIRRHYQIWHFSYPPGLHFFYSAYLFRTKLDEIYQFFDPAGQNKYMKSAVIVAHSMGGLLSRTVSSESGQKLWNSFFKTSPEQLPLKPADIQLLKDVFQFHTKPYIKRVIFLATPHRGSALADSFLGRLGIKCIFTPKRIMGIVKEIWTAAQDLARPELLKAFSEGDPNSVKSLSPQCPAIRALYEIPLSSKVHFHSIIGDTGEDISGSTDGIVPYSSSHIEDADSELIVPSHHDVHRQPLAVMEIKRILKLHLKNIQQENEEQTPQTHVNRNS